MGIHRGPNIIRNGLVFTWDGSSRSWDGSSTSHTELISGKIGTNLGANASLGLVENHVSFSGVGNRVNYISFPSADVIVPTGDSGTWMWAHYFIDAGNQDHPNIGKEASNAWDGVDGFVFGTGYGSDGLRVGIGGTAYQPYITADNNATYKFTTWQIYCVTYERNTVDGLKTYILDTDDQRLADASDTSDSPIGSNSNALHIGATNIRAGNWNGNMDFVHMWDRALTQEEVYQCFYAKKGRYGY